MKSCENFVSEQSNYFVHLPSAAAEKTFFYPICTGDFIYEAGYSLKREAYDSFLLMYIRSGHLTLEYEGRTEVVNAGSFVLLDCYRPHVYYSDTGWESLWFHFDGPAARVHYELITSQLGQLFTLARPWPVLDKMTSLYRTFLHGEPVREALLSKLITDILTSLLLSAPSVPAAANHAGIAEDIVSYIQEHYAEDLTIQKLASRAGLSQYHFIRIFRRETGFTPHEYIRNFRINTAKYLLKTSRLSVKDICFETGFSSVSVFCSAFRKKNGLTPTEYRISGS